VCLSCGCLRPVDDHGNPANLTLAGLEVAAAAGGASVAEAAWNIPRTLTVATSPAWPPEPFHATARPTLIWDVDGILAFTAEAMVAALNARFDAGYNVMTQSFFPGTLITSALPAEQASWLSAELASFRIYGASAPDWHAIDTMMDASRAGYPTCIVTERAPDLAVLTTQWLASWGVAKPPHVTAVGRGHKPRYLAAAYGPASPAILIDDNPVFRLSIARPGLEVWTPQRPYTPTTTRDSARTFPDWPTARYWLGVGQAV
jgi:hypothetical protein